MNLTDKERALIISALEGDKQGSWASDRGESIKRLIIKLEKEGK